MQYRLSRPKINGTDSETWYVVWSEGGRSRRASTRTTDRLEAERFLARFAHTLGAPPEAFNLNDLADAYVKDRTLFAKSPKTIKATLKPIRAHFGSYPPSLITRQLCRDYVTDRTRQGRAKSTIDKELRHLRQVLRFGVRDDWMADAPYIPTPGGNPPRRRYLLREEYERVKSHAAPHMAVFLSLALNTAARKAAILELTWAQVDFERGLIWYEQTDHNKRRAVVPMNPELRGDLKRAKKAARTRRVVEFREKPVKDVKKAWQRACERAGVSGVRIHDLRRTAASFALMSGATFAQVAALLGDSEEVVRKHYAQFSPDFLGSAVDMIGTHGAHNARTGGTLAEHKDATD